MLYMPHNHKAIDFPFVLRIQIPKGENASLGERPTQESLDERNVRKNFICTESSMHIKIQDPDSATLLSQVGEGSGVTMFDLPNDGIVLGISLEKCLLCPLGMAFKLV